MEQIRHWLFSMLYTGCFCSLIAMINPEENTKKILEILCAAIMGLTFISPILEFSTEDLTAFLNNSVELKPSAIIEYSVEQAYMEGKYSAYICNEASLAGVELNHAAVTVKQDASSNWIPDSVYYDTGQIIPAAFKEHIAKTLGVPLERQYINEGT